MKTESVPWPPELEGLPLSSIERFHLLDSTPSYPNNNFARFVLAGQLDPEIAQRAWHQVFQRHPLIAARVEQRGRRRVWVRDPAELAQVDWRAPLPPSQQMHRIDPGRERGVQVRAGTVRGRTEVMFHAHHVALDGVGGIQFTTDWLRIYDNLARGRAPGHGLPRLDSGRLRDRNDLRMGSRRYIGQLWKQPVGLYGAAKFVGRRIVPLVDPPDSETDWDWHTQPLILGEWLSPGSTMVLRERAQQIGVSFNSLLLGKLFQFLADWRCRESSGRDRDWLRVILPINLRDISDRRLSACNRTTLVQIDRRPIDSRDEFRYLRSLDREVEVIRRWQLGKLFLLAIRGLSVSEGWLEAAARRRKCRGTAVFTGLGEPLGRCGFVRQDDRIQIGGLPLESFDFVGPVRWGTPLYVNWQKHLTQTRISFHVDPRAIHPERAGAMLRQYVDLLEETAAQGSGGGGPS